MATTTRVGSVQLLVQVGRTVASPRGGLRLAVGVGRRVGRHLRLLAMYTSSSSKTHDLIIGSATARPGNERFALFVFLGARASSHKH
jgi:hypothetical protein